MNSRHSECSERNSECKPQDKMTLACVSIKIGVITKTSRTNVSIEKPTFTFDEEADSFDELQAKIEHSSRPRGLQA